MARIRTVKPDLWKSPIVAGWSYPARLLYIGLWNYCDDEARGVDDARLLKAEIFPVDDKATPKKIEGWLREIEASGRIIRYESAGKRLLCVPSMLEHQRIDKPRPSLLPPPPITEPEQTVLGSFSEASHVDRDRDRDREGKRTGKGIQDRASGAPSENGQEPKTPEEALERLNIHLIGAMASAHEGWEKRLSDRFLAGLAIGSGSLPRCGILAVNRAIEDLYEHQAGVEDPAGYLRERALSHREEGLP